jgi:hypothetical protein
VGPVPVLAQFVYFVYGFLCLFVIHFFIRYLFFLLLNFIYFYYFLIFNYLLIHLSFIRFLSLSPNPFFLVSFFLSTHALNKMEP